MDHSTYERAPTPTGSLDRWDDDTNLDEAFDGYHSDDYDINGVVTPGRNDLMNKPTDELLAGMWPTHQMEDEDPDLRAAMNDFLDDGVDEMLENELAGVASPIEVIVPDIALAIEVKDNALAPPEVVEAQPQDVAVAINGTEQVVGMPVRDVEAQPHDVVVAVAVAAEINGVEQVEEAPAINVEVVRFVEPVPAETTMPIETVISASVNSPKFPMTLSEYSLLSPYDMRAHARGPVQMINLLCARDVNSMFKRITFIMTRPVDVKFKDEVAMTGVAYLTSHFEHTYNEIMRIGSWNEKEGTVILVDPTLKGLRSKRFIDLLRDMRAHDPLHDFVFEAAALSLEVSTPSHDAIPVGRYEAMVTNIRAEVNKIPRIDVVSITPERMQIFEAKAFASKKESPKIREMNLAISIMSKRVKRGDHDHLLIDLGTGNAYNPKELCMRVVMTGGSHDNKLMSGVNVDGRFLTLHLGAVMFAAVRLIADHLRVSPDTFLKSLENELPLFEQREFVATKRPVQETINEQAINIPVLVVENTNLESKASGNQIKKPRKTPTMEDLIRCNKALKSENLSLKKLLNSRWNEEFNGDEAVDMDDSQIEIV